MAEAPPKLIYIVPVDEAEPEGRRSFRYTRSVLQSTLHLMGCKARHAFKISRRVFEVIRSKVLAGDPCSDFSQVSAALDTHDKLQCTENDTKRHDSLNSDSCSAQDTVDNNSSVPFELYKRKTTAFVTRETFLTTACDALSEYKYVGPYQKADFVLACRIRERRESVTILLCGTSGCGKSTLSALMGSRLGITTVVSTDSIRHMMRSFVDEKENPLLWASTYHAGECLDPVAVAQAKAKRKAKKRTGPSSLLVKEDVANRSLNAYHDVQPSALGNKIEVGKKLMAIEGYKAQSEMVIDSLDRLISAWEDRKESVIVEGVHLSLNFVMGLMKKHPSIIPFMICIANEDKHMERFAVRAKYMTLDPAKNKYVKYIRNIRTIQEYLCKRADKHLVPKVNNTNVDKSVAAIHATVFSSLRRRAAGEELYDPATNTVPLIEEEYRKQCAANSMSSKGMFQVIQRQGSSRHLMALLNTDGSVAKAWPVKSGDTKEPHLSGDKGDNCGGSVYGPLKIGKAEPVNLQFGTYGISAWTTDTGGTSHYGSIEESFGDCSDMGSRYLNSNSPKTSDGAAKELMDGASISGSEDEIYEPDDGESNGDQSDMDDKEMIGEIEGSVDEGSCKSDEEFEDLAMQDSLENGYCSDDEDKPNKMRNLTGAKKLTLDSSDMMAGDYSTKKYQQNMEVIPKRNPIGTDSSCSYSFLTNGTTSGFDPKAKKRFPVNSRRPYCRSLSIPASGKSAS